MVVTTSSRSVASEATPRRARFDAVERAPRVRPGSRGAMRLSVIVTTYNQPAWLEKVLWGFSAQTFQDFELLIADDGSDRPTRDTIERLRGLLEGEAGRLGPADEEEAPQILGAVAADGAGAGRLGFPGRASHFWCCSASIR